MYYTTCLYDHFREGFSLSNKEITDFGWKIKKKLAELRLDQKTFCIQYDIPQSRLSNIIHGKRRASQYRKQVADLLGIEDKDCEH